MKPFYYIVIVLLLSSSAGVWAQDNVVVHTDPRLSVLLKKQHNDELASTAVVVHRAAAKASSRPVAVTGGRSTTTANTMMPNAMANAPVVSSAGAAAPVKPLAPTYKGHAAGWEPYSQRKERIVYSGKGFRVQIYNGTDRNKAIAIKSEFMRNNPGVRTYLTYISPCFRVKVGNFKRRSDAMGTLREANSTYNPSMIVPDVVTISTF